MFKLFTKRVLNAKPNKIMRITFDTDSNVEKRSIVTCNYKHVQNSCCLVCLWISLGETHEREL